MEGFERVMVVLAAGPQSVSSARRQTRAIVERWVSDPDQVDDIVLVVSELVGNAVLHTGDAQSLALVRAADRIRVEVADRGHQLPSPNPYGPEAQTGRGIALVGALSMDWGAAVQESGKVVWADVATTATEGRRVEAPFSGGSPPRGAPDGHVKRVAFLQVPVATYAALQEQNDALHREVDLLLIGTDRGMSPPAPPELLDAARQLRRHFGASSGALRERVFEAAGMGQTTIDLDGWFTSAAVQASVDYVTLVERVEDFASSGVLFVDRPHPAVSALRRWFVTEVNRQLSGDPPSPAPPDLPT